MRSACVTSEHLGRFHYLPLILPASPNNGATHICWGGAFFIYGNQRRPHR
ncbi:hypothetical protein APS_2007 [Acetobacter pasteurianus subsp. pasteurianus LMG 1262 = NBRC 106471]|nr:hypothetical protein APS_2007 [Acetobacter pasteurianus subsp. pasteurianus LMG 1262 = NBRC 106471]